MQRFLNTKSAAKLLDVSPGFLERRRVEGGGPIFAKLGSRVVYGVDDLSRWVDERSRRTTSEIGQADE
jgi:hypothetical protein